MADSALQFPEYAPEFEVWNHLHSGLDLARDELDSLEPETRKTLEALGKVVFLSRTGAASGKLKAEHNALLEDFLREPWFRHVVDISFAEDAITRGQTVLDRYARLRPIWYNYQISDQPIRFVGEAVQTFLFGFDIACIAICGAALEQVLKDTLLARGAIRKGSHDPLGGRALVDKAKNEKIISKSVDAAKTVIKSRNRVMHRQLKKTLNTSNMALQSVSGLLAVLDELGQSNSEEDL